MAAVPSCDVCLGSRVKLVTLKSSPYRPAWECADCQARVGCYEGTTTPLGRLADAATRRARAHAHIAFDPLWQHGLMTRGAAYKWLQHAMELTEAEAHFAMFDLAQAEHAAKLASNYYAERLHLEQRRLAKRKEKARARRHREAERIDRFRHDRGKFNDRKS